MSSAIEIDQKAGIKLAGIFTSGVISFYAKVDAVHFCCYQLKVYLNDDLQYKISGGDWQQYTVNISAGEHEIKWVYERDHSSYSELDAAFIDGFSFTIQ